MSLYFLALHQAALDVNRFETSLTDTTVPVHTQRCWNPCMVGGILALCTAGCILYKHLVRQKFFKKNHMFLEELNPFSSWGGVEKKNETSNWNVPYIPCTFSFLYCKIRKINYRKQLLTLGRPGGWVPPLPFLLAKYLGCLRVNFSSKARLKFYRVLLCMLKNWIK